MISECVLMDIGLIWVLEREARIVEDLKYGIN